jgi:hypothetical protein
MVRTSRRTAGCLALMALAATAAWAQTEEAVIGDTTTAFGGLSAQRTFDLHMSNEALITALKLAMARNDLDSAVADVALEADIAAAAAQLSTDQALPGQARGTFMQSLSGAYGTWSQGLSSAYQQLAQSTSTAVQTFQQECSQSSQVASQRMSTVFQRAQQQMNDPAAAELAPTLTPRVFPVAPDTAATEAAGLEARGAVDKAVGTFRGDLAQQVATARAAIAAALLASADDEIALRGKLDDAVKALRIHALDGFDALEIGCRGTMRKAALGEAP